MTKYNRPNGKLFGSSASNIGVFGSGQGRPGETPTTSTNPNAINTLSTHWEEGWDGAVVSQAPYTAPFIEDMNAVNYVNSYNSAYLLQRGIPEYSATEEYQEDSVCTYNGEIWICQTDGTVGVTPDESAPEWHQQTEVPVMQDNEILVGDTGNGATVTDTLNQGDILASTTGLDVKAGVITNTHISSQAGDKIAESKLDLAYTTSTLNTNIGNVSNSLTSHTSDSNNPHSTTLANLVGNNLSTPSDQDTLVYDNLSSKWINQENSLDNLSNATITTPSNKDVLWYSGGSWVNTPDVNNHMVSKVNPHETKIANLNDANASTPSDQDTLVYDGNSSKWINQPNTVENLKNTNISTISDGQILSYDSGNSEWVNTTNSIDNLSDTTITSASSGDVLAYNGSKWINQDNNVSNLTDTTITSASSGDALVYNGSKWINQANSVDNLTNTTISSAGAGDVLAYDNLNSKWINQENSVENLSNTTITSATLGDVLTYDGSGWINSPNTSGSLAGLSDTTITTPSDKQLLQYDYANSKWINSSDVWNRIEVNDVAYINNAVSDVTLTDSSKRHQIFTATDGFNVTLPSTNIKAGETFVFDWRYNFGSSLTTAFVFKSSNGTAMKYAYVNNFTYYFTALVDTPTTSSDWIFKYYRKISYNVENGATCSMSSAATSFTGSSPTIITLKRGVYHLDIHYYINTMTYSSLGMGLYVSEGGIGDHVKSLGSASSSWIWIFSPGTVTGGGVDTTYISGAPINKSLNPKLRRKANSITGRLGINALSPVQAWGVYQVEARLIQPITDTDII